MSGPPAIEISGVAFAYGARPALRDVSLSAPQGAVTALLGANGAGKSTLVALATRLFRPDAGRIAICGHDVSAEPGAALGRLGVVFQSRSLDANLSVRENMAYQGALHGLRRREALTRAEAALERLGMADRLADRAGALSGGQQRRVEIAGALLHAPRALLCDEATAGLDIEARAALVRDVHALAAEQGVGVLWATHLTDEITPEDRVVVLHDGAVLAEAPAAEIAGGRPLADAFLALIGRAAA